MVVLRTESFEVDEANPHKAIDKVKNGGGKSTGSISYRVTATLTLGAKAKNAAGAAGRIATSIFGGQGITVSNEEQARRMAICATCEFFTGTTCRKCGCHIRFKAKLQTEHCPIGKW